MRLVVNAGRAVALGAAMVVAAGAAATPIPYKQFRAMERAQYPHHAKPTTAHAPTTQTPKAKTSPASAPTVKSSPAPVKANVKAAAPGPPASHPAVAHPPSPPPHVAVVAAGPPPARPPATHPPAEAAAAPPAAPSAPETPATAAPNAPRLAPGTPIPPAELEALVDGVVGEAMAEDHIAGVTVAVVQNGQVVLKKGYGFAGPNRPVDPDNTLFRLGSVSKTFTWITLMKEAEAGRMRLDAPVNLYLPEALQVRDQGFKRPILIRDLMTHSPGFEDRTFGQLFEEKPNRIRSLSDYLRQETPRRVREAGQLSVYSNYGVGLAGAAVAYVNGHPFQDIVDAEIIRPLGLAHTTFREPYPPRSDLPDPMPAALASSLSTGYRWTGAGFEPQSFVYATQIAPAAAASSTAADMARYMLMILGGGQLEGASVYSPATAHGFQTTLQSSAPGVNGWDDGFLEFSLPGGVRGQGHLGDALWFKTAMVVVPTLNLGVFVSANTDTGAGLASRLPQTIVGRFYGPPEAPPAAGSPELTADRAVYAGTYLNDRRPYSGLEKFVFMLIGQIRVSVTDDGRLITAGGGAVRTWLLERPGLFREADGPATSAFLMRDGRAVRWFDPTGTTAFDRVGPLERLPVFLLVAALAAVASIAVLVGVVTRDRRDARQSPTQIRASLIQTTIAVLWLIAMAGFVLWARSAANVANVIYHWPGPWLLIASACALVAAVLTAITVILIPAVWRGGRRVDSWTIGRKFRFTVSTVVFAGFSVMLALWGALEPWSG